ncbi:hypothetical protein BGZ94_003789 [Podila epigama]|nr:hypothetical protein BGZ94_003789 [Podila epigama]
MVQPIVIFHGVKTKTVLFGTENMATPSGQCTIFVLPLTEQMDRSYFVDSNPLSQIVINGIFCGYTEGSAKSYVGAEDFSRRDHLTYKSTYRLETFASWHPY